MINVQISLLVNKTDASNFARNGRVAYDLGAKVEKMSDSSQDDLVLLVGPLHDVTAYLAESSYSAQHLSEIFEDSTILIGTGDPA